MALSVGFIRFVSSTDATRATGLLTFTLVGLIPTEHICLVWTHSLLKSPFLLRLLMLRPASDILPGHDGGARVLSLDPAIHEPEEASEPPLTRAEVGAFNSGSP